jgi:hypothetical protein
MFNLDQAIAQWRRQMIDGGITRVDLVDELESHLRDAVEEQARSGLNIEQSFQRAAEEIGACDRLRVEFAKLRTTKEDRMNHNRIYAAVLWIFALYNSIIIACAIHYAYVIDRALWTEPMGHFPPWALPWLFALTCFYTALIVATLVARRKDHTLGERLSRVLNWLMLAALPAGTVIGLYGLLFVDKQTAQRV